MTKKEINHTLDYTKDFKVKSRLKLASKKERISEDIEESSNKKHTKRIETLQIEIEKQQRNNTLNISLLKKREKNKGIQDLYVEMLNEKLSYLEKLF